MTSLNNQRLYLQIAAHIIGQHLHNIKIICTKQIKTQDLFIATTLSRKPKFRIFFFKQNQVDRDSI